MWQVLHGKKYHENSPPGGYTNQTQINSHSSRVENLGISDFRPDSAVVSQAICGHSVIPVRISLNESTNCPWQVAASLSAGGLQSSVACCRLVW
jgi:hypothetical protein